MFHQITVFPFFFCFMVHNEYLAFFQEIARGKTTAGEEIITLDIHSINHLQNVLKLPRTEDSFKYKYTSDSDGSYSK